MRLHMGAPNQTAQAMPPLRQVAHPQTYRSQLERCPTKQGGDAMNAKFNVIDLFGAPGGLALGFHTAGRYNILACVDSDEVAAATYQANFPHAHVTTDCIENVTTEDLLNAAGVGRDEIDVMIGGPPCPGFSIVGRVKMASLMQTGGWKHHEFIDELNGLYKHFVGVVKEFGPKYFVMENVLGIVSHNGGKTVRQIVKDFNVIGYATDWKILNAVEYGVPQVRKRVFFIGNKLGLPNPFPVPTHRSFAKRDNDEGNLKNAVSVWNGIGDLPRLHAGEGEEKSSYGRKPATDYQRWARRHSKYVFNHVSRPHGGRDLKLFRHLREGMKWKDLPARIKRMYGYRDDVFDDKMKRLQRNRPSWTVVAHLAKDGYMYIHPTQDRTITVREAARLQSFPDTFIFCGSRSSQFRQVGNAVPPLLARAVACEIRKALGGALA